MWVPDVRYSSCQRVPSSLGVQVQAWAIHWHCLPLTGALYLFKPVIPLGGTSNANIFVLWVRRYRTILDWQVLSFVFHHIKRKLLGLNLGLFTLQASSVTTRPLATCTQLIFYLSGPVIRQMLKGWTDLITMTSLLTSWKCICLFILARLGSEKINSSAW